MKTFQQWYTPEMSEHLWENHNGDELAEAAYLAGQEGKAGLEAELRRTRNELDRLRQKLYGDKIDRLIQRFDFNKVHKAMTALKWTWRDEGVPTIDSLKQTARELLESAASSEHGNIMTGGFKAEYHKDGNFTLEFILAEVYSSEEEY